MEIKMKKYTAGQTVYVVGKPGVESGKPVTFLKEIPGVGYAVGYDTLTLLVEPVYVTHKILDVAA